jgi:hypothetical protein
MLHRLCVHRRETLPVVPVIIPCIFVLVRSCIGKCPIHSNLLMFEYSECCFLCLVQLKSTDKLETHLAYCEA